MKKFTKTIILVTGIIGLNLHVNSQNTFPANGNVGIGTTTPQNKLDIRLNRTNFKTYIYGPEITVNTSGGWARGYRIRNEKNNSTVSYGALNGNAYISTGFDLNSDATGYKNQKLTILTNGNTGIGTTSPGAKLDVNGTFIVDNKASNHSSIKIGHDSQDRIYADNSSNKTYGGGYFFRVSNANNNGYINALMIADNGNIGIGTKSKNNTAKLTVKGDIHATEIKVKVNAGADFVFANDYNLPTLASVEAFITKNKHLPTIAPANKMEIEGLELGEMNIRLLQKVEELTLYTIQQEKKLQKLTEALLKIEQNLAAKNK